MSSSYKPLSTSSPAKDISPPDNLAAGSSFETANEQSVAGSEVSAVSVTTGGEEFLFVKGDSLETRNNVYETSDADLSGTSHGTPIPISVEDFDRVNESSNLNISEIQSTNENKKYECDLGSASITGEATAVTLQESSLNISTKTVSNESHSVDHFEDCFSDLHADSSETVPQSQNTSATEYLSICNTPPAFETSNDSLFFKKPVAVPEVQNTDSNVFDTINRYINDANEHMCLESVATQTEITNSGNRNDELGICHKHQNVRTSDTSSLENPTLCQTCSKSMLRYIMLVQQFLDGVAKDVSKQVDPLAKCYECVKENISWPCHDHQVNTDNSFSLRKDQNATSVSGASNEGDARNNFTENSREYGSTDNSTKTHHPNIQKSEKTNEQDVDQSVRRPQKSGEEKPSSQSMYQKPPEKHDETKLNADHDISISKQFSIATESSQHIAKPSGRFWGGYVYDNGRPEGHTQQQHPLYITQMSEAQTVHDLHQNYSQSSAGSAPMELTPAHGMIEIPSQESLVCQPPPEYPLGNGVDGILSTLYKVERGLTDATKGPTVWERMAEMFQQQPAYARKSRVTHEAFVTLARTNAEALGCLVLGSSLLLCATSRTLCVIVSDAVSPAFMAPLSSVFHSVQHSRSYDSVGTTKLALLDQPELGITFGKLNVWRVQGFSKCVYLNPDTVVVQNCDELFCHDELSAVPDIGWPDCFNSGVFVFQPSIQTFWMLLNHASEVGAYEGGDQVLLNSYFYTWSQDIHKKLSFIYNLIANVSYTYTPAFEQFGRSVKIVQFQGPFKPWHVKFYTNTGQIAPASSVHPTYVQFVHVWLNVFRVSILPLFSQEIQSYVSSEGVICACDLLRFYPSKETEIEFFLAPPSVRVHPSVKSQKSMTVVEKLQLPVSTGDASLSENVSEEISATADETFANDDETADAEEEETESSGTTDNVFLDDSAEANATKSSAKGEKTKLVKRKSSIPGAEVGDYQGMSAWEQGRMDYEGNASSDTIMKRLNFLMGNPKRVV